MQEGHSGTDRFMDNEQNLKIPERGYRNLRKGRYSQVGNYYFITTATQRKEKIFQSERCARVVIDSIKWIEHRKKAENIVAIVMPEHLHWVFILKEGTLADIVKSLKGFTARKINQMLDRKGNIWQEQYYEHLVRKNEALLNIAKYCLNNSVRRGLVDDFHCYPYWLCKYEV